MLFGDVVATQPVEVQPIPNLILHFTPLWLATLVPKSPRVVRTLEAHNVADGAIVNALDRLLLGEVVAVAEPRN